MDIINNIYLNGVVVLSLFIISFYLGLLAFIRNRRSQVNLIFARFAIATSFWILFAYIPDVPFLRDFSIISGKLNYIALLVVAYSLFQLPFVFPTKRSLSPFIQYGVLVMGIIIAGIAFFTDKILKDLQYYNWGASYVDGDFAVMFYVYMLLVVLSVVVQYIYLWRRFDVRERIQVRLFGIGLSIFMVTNILVQSIVKPLIMHTDEFYKVGNYSVIFMIAFTGYAIIKHHFMDIKLIVARAVSYSLLIGCFALLYALTFALMSSLFVPTAIGLRAIAVSTLLALLMAFSFQPIRRFLEQITDRIFYKNHYHTDELLYNLALIMAATLRLEDLTHHILQEMLRQMRITKGAFILLEKGHVYQIAQEGLPKALEVDEQSVVTLLNQNKALIFEELPEGPIKEIMRSMEFTLISPLASGGEYFGLLALGEKLSGDIYTTEDIKVVEILAPEAAVAIQNAKAYEEISRFNITLQEEVEIATKSLQDANVRLKELDHLKDDFVSIASHELRTPMTAIRSYAWMALHRSDVPLSKTLEKYLARVLISTERLINLVNDMLNVSRIESSKIEINPEPVDLLSLAKDIVDELYYSKQEEKRIEFVVLERPIPKVFADPEKLRQVFLNLVGNSLKFTPTGGKITFDFFTDGKTVETGIIDTGVGISKEDLSKLFHKFSRLDNSYTAAATSGGTGLGLYISKSLVDLMHGRIWASSQGAGKGTTFTVSLPVVTPEVLKNIESYKVKPQGAAKPLEPAVV